MARKVQSVQPPPVASKPAGFQLAKTSAKPTLANLDPQKAQAAQAIAREKRRTSLAACTATYSRLRERYPEHDGKILNLSKGSLKAAVALKCIDCACGQITEIRECTALGCPLWPVRPYKELAK